MNDQIDEARKKLAALRDTLVASKNKERDEIDGLLTRTQRSKIRSLTAAASRAKGKKKSRGN